MRDKALSHRLNVVERHLADLVEELELGLDEYERLIGFLTDIAKRDQLSRLFGVLGMTRAVHSHVFANGSDKQTTSMPRGPYYTPGAPLSDAEADIRVPDTKGEPLRLAGCVVSAESGQPVPGAIVDFWHGDGHGDYCLDGYELRGRIRTGSSGEYCVTTVIPAGYPVCRDGSPLSRVLDALGRHNRRPAHIHAEISAAGFCTLTTQLYPSEDPLFDSDVLKLTDPSLLFDLDRSGLERDGYAQARFDFRLRPAPGASGD